MIQGYSTLGAVALRLIEDNYRFSLKSSTKYSLDQAVEVVCNRRRSVAGMDDAPSYLWWWFSMDEGELQVDFDRPKLHGVCLDREKWKWRYVSPTDDLDPHDLIGSEWKSDRWYTRDEFITRTEEAMIRMGVQPYQKCLSRYRIQWHTDYWGESDSETDLELLYVEPLGQCSTIYMPVPLGNLGIAPPKMRQVTFA